MNISLLRLPRSRFRPLAPVAIPSVRALRWALVTPLVALIALATLMGVSIWYLTMTEAEQRQLALMRDVSNVQQTIREDLRRDEDDLRDIGRQMLVRPSATEFKRLAEGFFPRSQRAIFVAWVDRNGVIRAIQTSQGIPRQSFGQAGSVLSRPASRQAFDYALSGRKPAFSEPIAGRESDVEIDLHIPMISEAGPQGTLVVTYSLPSLLLSGVSNTISNRVAFALVDTTGQTLAQTRSIDFEGNTSYYDALAEPLPASLRLRAISIQPFSSLYIDVITVLIAGLILLAVISQIAVWRNTRERIGIERILAEETAFRRAMENSMSTGMRVIDLSGVITYVNPAFCRMVGFTAEELTGHTAPYPYWPPESAELLQRTLERMLTGESPPSALPIHIMRKDGTRLIVRMYTSPLIDQSGKQTGWMTSVTDISEQTRIRQELAQAQERFITVLQALDAAVSVASPPPGEDLLFANQAYKKWFGNSLADGHRALSDTLRGPWADVREVFNAQVQRWFEVRIRSIKWVDGRAVELLVATDITQERANEQAQREQHERLQQTARLVTMGEMASSLAHELNQPLTAIANYTSGAVSRIRMATSRGEQLALDELIDMLGKTARQAERAGQVIRRIRGFVKRSDPIRKPSDARTIMADAIGLAEIDAREQGITIEQEIGKQLPLLNVDPILIEQVLLNLVKNGLEAMRQSSDRRLTVRVATEDHQVVFSVQDRGHGIPEAIRGRLFDSFYTTKTDGMGMGLNICRSIIESHQGRLWFEHNTDGGCTFRFTLPI
jgi:PAS domain S-box-containing protein